MQQAPNESNSPNKKIPKLNQVVTLAAVFVVIFLFFVVPYLVPRQNIKTIGYSQLLNLVENKQVSKVSINNANGQITGTLKDGQTFNSAGPSPVIPQDIQLMRQNGVNVSFPGPGISIASIFWDVFWIGLAVGGIVFLMRATRAQRASIMSIGQSRAKLYTNERPKTKFSDVAGYNGVKMEIAEIVDFLRNPARYWEIGAKIPRGILLVGPPGTGKTLLARAVAGEAGVPFLSVVGSDFMEMFVGVGASRVRDLFRTARKQAPCIIFVDEIDSIGRKRGTGLGGSHDEREQTLNQMLAEIDGFDSAEGVIMLAATNRPDVLDLALLRPGRFDRQIVVPLPDFEERVAILQVHCRDKKVSPLVNLELVARGTPGMSGAELAALVNEAALHAVRRQSSFIEMQDFEAARDRGLMGQRRESTVLSQEERERVAYHEGGHAVLAYVLENADPLHKVTILPTGMALGVTQQLPMEERHIYKRDVVEDRLCVTMGGRAAELLIFGDLSTGAANDLQKNTELARKMVREWGFSKRLGPIAWGSDSMVFLGEDLLHSRDYSEATSRVVDEEISQLLQEQEKRALETLKKHEKGLEKVAEALLAKETITGEEVARLVDEANGGPVHIGKSASVPHFTPNEALLGQPHPGSVAATNR